ncbi:MAG TPA: ribosome maturation factor RimM [Aestuariivirga sp.]|nr:ribosome maturation factor RimM [Aestuariivirga sp.]
MGGADLVHLGTVRAAHGIKGHVKVEAFTERPENLGAYGPLFTRAGKSLTVKRLKVTPDMVIVTFAGITDRTAAEALKGTELFVPRAALPAPKDDEIYLADLEGAKVFLDDGVLLGQVAGFHDYGAGPLVEIAVTGRTDTVLVPFARPFIAAAEAGSVTLNLPEGYLDDASPGEDR